MTEDYDTTERVDQYENGVRLHVRSKRGTEPRDEDKVSGELNADTIAELEAGRADLREAVVETLAELRCSQPDSKLLTPSDQSAVATDLTDVLDSVSDHAPAESREELQRVIEDLLAE